MKKIKKTEESLKTLKLRADIVVPFYKYKTKALNKEAEKQIINKVKDALIEINFIDLEVEKNKEGGTFEDCTKEVEFKVKVLK